jgi:membrane glycosyltransferase
MRATEASLKVARYLDRLQLPAETRAAVEARIAIEPGTTPAQAMARLHLALAGEPAQASDPVDQVDQVDQADPAYGSVAARIRLADAAPGTGETEQGHARLACTPPLNRVSMTPHPWGTLNAITRWSESVLRRPRDWLQRRPAFTRQPWPADSPQAGGNAIDASAERQPTGGLRRGVLLLLMLSQTALATWFMSRVLPYQGTRPMEIVTMLFFAVLFCWVSAGFWTAMTGFLVLLRGSDRYLISRNAADRTPIAETTRTAIVMPICNEDVTAVFAGLRATYDSVARTGDLDRFDFFVLSDSSQSDTCAAEVAAWAASSTGGAFAGSSARAAISMIFAAAGPRTTAT